MGDKYRIVKVNTVDGTSDNRPRRNQDIQAPADQGNVQPASVRRRTRRWMWGLCVVVFVVFAAVWMYGAQASLAELNQTATHNANTLATQQSELSSIQSHLNSIDAQLGRIQAQIQSFLTSFMQSLHHR